MRTRFSLKTFYQSSMGRKKRWSSAKVHSFFYKEVVSSCHDYDGVYPIVMLSIFSISRSGG